MFLTGAEALGMTHRQCLDLLESAEDIRDPRLKAALQRLAAHVQPDD